MNQEKPEKGAKLQKLYIKYKKECKIEESKLWFGSISDIVFLLSRPQILKNRKNENSRERGLKYGRTLTQLLDAYIEKTVYLRELYFGPQNQKILLPNQYHGMVLKTIRV